ncbi:MAG: hypothetical protein JWP49_2029 [Phenylobacterium sp.]|nr:hypothetical protein [Phenylobacterium sp.]
MRLLSLALAFVLLAAWPATAKTPLPTFAKYADYATVRTQLLQRGYTPVHVAKQDVEDCQEHKTECRLFPELWRCSYAMGQPCEYVWRSRARHFIVLSAIAGDSPNAFILDVPTRAPTAKELSDILKPQHSDLPKFKRHTPYGEVRRQLLNLGFKPIMLAEPLSPECSPYGDRCTRWPELESCSGTGIGYCKFGFRAPSGRWVALLTVGDEPGFYRIWYAGRGDVGEFRRQMIERQTYRPYD